MNIDNKASRKAHFKFGTWRYDTCLILILFLHLETLFVSEQQHKRKYETDLYM